MTTMEKSTAKGEKVAITIATKEEWDSNLRQAERFFAKVQQRLEQMRLNSDEDKAEWGKTIDNITAEIPKGLAPEVTSVLENTLKEIKDKQKPEEIGEMWQNNDCVLRYAIRIFETFFTPKYGKA